MDLIIVFLILYAFGAFFSWICRKTKKEAAAMGARETSPCDNCPFWSECQGEDKEDCMLYKAEDEIYV